MLIADVDEAVERIRTILGDGWDTTIATTMRAAIEKLEVEAAYDLVICGLHFDESKMYDFLRYARSRPFLKETPFICVQIIHSALFDVIKEGLNISIHALGACDFIDVLSYDERYGEKANEMIRARIERRCLANE